MTASFIIFWVSVAVLVYCYFGYGLIAFLLVQLKKLFIQKKERLGGNELLPVTLIITAFNEEAILEQKIRNTLAINYPGDKLSVIFVTDGSTDDSNRIIKQYPVFSLLHQQDRQGKYAAIKRAMRQVQTSVVVFSDANTMLNSDCIRHIISHYQYPVVGAVAGEKRVNMEPYASAVGKAEGLYWQYESFLKKMDAGLYTVTGAAGELFSIRTSLFKELDNEIILDDFITSMRVCVQGYKIAYEPNAFATEHPSASLAEEEKRKVRISAGAYQSIGYLAGCLNVFKQPVLAFQFISRRLLRWIFCPVLIIALLLSNIFIAINYAQPDFYSWTLYVQLFFYLLALTGWLLASSGKKPGLFTIPFYFIFMNYCLVKGFIKFIRGKQTVLWEKSLRQVME
ncbi:MAG: glycosyltransferase family 2 protein [Chitinophagaceae bacterium]|nr:glycosyltransferase family 2 protein [Chitinophagaceae bacterium]